VYCCSQGLADNCVIAKVNNEVWDLDRPLEGDCKLHLLKFDDPDGLFFVPYCLNIAVISLSSVTIRYDTVI